MSASVLATGRAFSSQRRRAAGCRAGSPRARTHPTKIDSRYSCTPGALTQCHCPFDHDRIWIRFFGRLGTARHFSRPNFCSGTRCAHQFWPQCARSAASAGARLAAGPAAGQAARARTHPTEIGARIQPDLRIQIVHALSQLDSCTRGWMGGRACDGMESTARTRRAAQYF